MRIVSVLQRLHGEIGPTTSDVQKRDGQTVNTNWVFERVTLTLTLTAKVLPWVKVHLSHQVHQYQGTPSQLGPFTLGTPESSKFRPISVH